LSEKVTPSNVEGLQKAMMEQDANQTGQLPNETFIRCLSVSEMKLSEREVEKLIKEMDTLGQG